MIQSSKTTLVPLHPYRDRNNFSSPLKSAYAATWAQALCGTLNPGGWDCPREGLLENVIKRVTEGKAPFGKHGEPFPEQQALGMNHSTLIRVYSQMQAREHIQHQLAVFKTSICFIFFFRHIQLLHRDLFTGVFLWHTVKLQNHWQLLGNDGQKKENYAY